MAEGRELCTDDRASPDLHARILAVVEQLYGDTYRSTPLAEMMRFRLPFNGLNFGGILSQVFLPIITALLELSGRSSPEVTI
jgi:hypothetical protein